MIVRKVLERQTGSRPCLSENLRCVQAAANARSHTKQTVDLNNLVPNTQATWLSAEMFSRAHTLSFQHPASFSHNTEANVGLGAAQNKHGPRLLATGPTVQCFSQEPLDACCWRRGAKYSFRPPPETVWGFKHISHKRSSEWKGLWLQRSEPVKPIKLCF